MTIRMPMSRRSILKSGAAFAASALAAAVPLRGAEAEDDWAATVAAAEAEGAVNIQGPTNDNYRATIQLFQTAYPKIALNYTSTTGDDFEARYTAERRANQYLSDFFIGGVSGPVYLDQIPAGWYSPLKPLIVQPDVVDDAKWLGGFQRGFLDAEGQYIYTGQANLQATFFYDSAVVSAAEFGKLEDVLDPKWKGKIAMVDPRLAQDQVATILLYGLGEDGLRKFLTDQQPVLTRNRRQIQEWAVRGAYPIIAGMTISELAQLQAQGLGTTIKRLQLTPALTTWTPGSGAVALLANVPHPNAAKLFINWFLSQAAQADWATRGHVNSRRTDVAAGLPDGVLTEDQFVNGLTFNSAAHAEVPRKAQQISTDVLG